MAVSSANMPASSRISSWLSGVSQSEEGVVLHSGSTPTFSHSPPSTYTPLYETPDTWDCITIVSDFPNVVPAHPLDILPTLLLNLLLFAPLCAPGRILPIVSPSSALDELTEIPQSSGSLLKATLLMLIP
jgi:hypothetical protein